MEPGLAPDLAEIRRSEQADTRAWDELDAAVLARSAGRSRTEVRQMLIAEVQSLNRPVPDDRILDLRVEQVTFAPQPLPPDASAFTALKALAGMVRKGRAVHKKAAAMRGEVHRLEGPRGQPPYLVEADYSLPMADVILGPGTAAILSRTPGGSVQLRMYPAGISRDPEIAALLMGSLLRSASVSRRRSPWWACADAVRACPRFRASASPSCADVS